MDILETLHGDEQFQKYLKEFAIADASHDLNVSRGEQGITTRSFDKFFFDKDIKDIGTPQPKHYNPGINIFDQWDNITWTTNGLNFKNAQLGYSGTFTTKSTNFNYEFKVFKDTDIESILQFIHGVKTTEELASKSVNFTIDVIKGHFIKTLQTTYENKNYGTIHILNVREQLNDAGNRTVFNSHVYGEHTRSGQKRNIELRSLNEISKQDITYPAWNLDRVGPRSDFFSNFSLKLSPPVYSANAITANISFLTIDKKPVGNVISLKSGDKNTNSVNSLIPLLEDIYDKVFVKKTLKKGWENIYFKLLQQKRSGDTLQMLSTLDKTRTYKQQGTNTIKTISSHTPTYFLTNDVWNPVPLGLYFGTNVIYQGYKQQTGDYIIVFRRIDSIPKPTNYLLRMDESGQEEMLDIYDDAVEKHTVVFEKQKETYLEQLRTLIAQPLPTTVDELNIKVSNVLKLSLSLALFINTYQPTEIPEELRDFSNPDTRFAKSQECIQRIENQKAKQLYSDTFQQTIQNMENLTLIQQLDTLKFNQILFIDTSRERKDYAKEISLLFKTISTLITSYYEYINELDTWFIKLRKECEVIKTSAISYERKTHFRSIQRLIEEAMYTHLKKSAKKRSRNNYEEEQEEEQEAPARTRPRTGSESELSTLISDAMSIRSALESRSGASSTTSFRGGQRRQLLKKRGGGDDDFEEPVGDGCELFSDMIIDYVRPIALRIARGEPAESWERTFVIKQLLRSVANYAFSAPVREEIIDDLSKWYPIFVDIMRQIVNNEDKDEQLIQLQFLLRIWFETDEFETIFSLDGSKSWHVYGRLAGELLLFQAFGPAYIDALSSIDEPIFDKVKFELEDIDPEKTYNDIFKLSDDYTIEEPSIRSKSEPIQDNLTESFIKNVEKGSEYQPENVEEPNIVNSNALSIENLMNEPTENIKGGRRRKTRRKQRQSL